ncbi:MAG: 2-oxoacid:acceptor oxidoreductase family protein [Bacillota bacterium]|jgi:indolepyruvate ferredoxin oxidoreductase beta subunit
MDRLFNIYMVGIGGQGVLSLADLLCRAAHQEKIPFNYYPTKGMSQRGGFVKAQVRLGSVHVGAAIPPKGADLVISMEISETLKALPYLKPQGQVLLYGNRWETTAVMTGNAHYPAADQVINQIEKSLGDVLYIEDDHEFKGKENLYVLGVAIAKTELRELFRPEQLLESIKKRWPKAAKENCAAFIAGYRTIGQT